MLMVLQNVFHELLNKSLRLSVNKVLCNDEVSQSTYLKGQRGLFEDIVVLS